MIAPTAFLVLAPLLAGGDGPAPEAVRWAAEHSIAVQTVEAGHGFEDLRPLEAWIGDARIVALGECTHGSREVFQMKHRLVEYLASEMGFSIFSIEANMPEAYRLNDYVLEGRGDPRALIAGMYFWTWNTEEVLALVEWMRAFNASGRGPLQFTGFDMQTPDVAMRQVRDFIVELDPEALPELEARYRAARDAEQVTSGGFGVCTGTFPVEAARGRSIRFRGFIRTEDLRDGWAGLWWRVDGPDGTLAFDNMQDRGPRDTTPWTEYVVELDVPANATNINFGVIMPGTGSAWFDDLQVELDGAVWVDPDLLFDLSFESDTIRGLRPMNPDYRATLDDRAPHGGRQSLRLQAVARPERAVDPAEALADVRDVLERLEARRDEFAAIAGAERTDRAIQDARVVVQSLEMRAGGGGLVRDRAMAENIGWILERNPGAKIVLWAHNGHVARRLGAMGWHLHERFGAQMRIVGFGTGEGEYRAVGEAGLGVHPLQPPPPGSVEAVLRATDRPRLVLDLRAAGTDGAVPDWLEVVRPFRMIGALAMDQQFFPAIVRDQYDLLVYIDRTSATVPLGEGRRR